MAIIGTLAAIGVPTAQKYLEKTQITRAIIDVRTIEREIANFSTVYGRLPVDLAEIGLDGLKDPWGNPYVYHPVGSTPKGKMRKDHFMVPVNSDYDLYSLGEDGKSSPPFTSKNSRDDIVRANDGQYVGLVANY